MPDHGPDTRYADHVPGQVHLTERQWRTLAQRAQNARSATPAPTPPPTSQNAARRPSAGTGAKRRPTRPRAIHPMTCTTCGETFTRETTMDAHYADTGHSRYEADLRAG